MRQMFQRRNTSPNPSLPEPTIGFGVPNTIEKLKRAPGFRFKDRERVRIMAPPEFAYKTGYIVEAHDVQNEHGLIEVELDHILEEGSGYEKLTDPKTARPRITVKNPERQLTSWRYMKCQSQHFYTAMRAEALSQMSSTVTYLLCAHILGFLITVKDGSAGWGNESLYVTFLMSASLCMGLGFLVVLLTAFVSATIKRMSASNNLAQNGAVHDDCLSYHWFKSSGWKPFWLACMHPEGACIEYLCDQAGRAIVAFVVCMIVSMLLYIADQTETWAVVICVSFMAVPTLMALHVIYYKGMMQL